ncbi:MAG: sigma-70 family RNA polymerase sigma factor [Myxococcales bacterium]|nr:sigma-70 family RNA polymerase sigma factor [Myxococcales bacterium]
MTSTLELGATATTDAEVASFDALYEKYAPFVWRTLRGFGVAQGDIADAVQEVFLIVHRRLDDFEGRSSLRTWLCSITLGVARNATRKRRREHAAHSSFAAGARAHGQSGAVEAIDLVNVVLDELDEDKRLVFVLAELEQLTAPEIAEALKMNVNSVYSRLRLARLAFEAGLAKHGGAS